MLTEKELEKIKEFHGKNDKKFPFPDLSSPLYPIQVPIYNDDELIGSYFVQITSEIIIVMDQSQSNLTLALAAHRSLPSIIQNCNHFGIDDIHAFVQDKKFADFLIKNIGFKKATGIPLFRKVNQ